MIKGLRISRRAEMHLQNTNLDKGHREQSRNKDTWSRRGRDRG